MILIWDHELLKSHGNVQRNTFPPSQNLSWQALLAYDIFVTNQSHIQKAIFCPQRNLSH